MPRPIRQIEGHRFGRLVAKVIARRMGRIAWICQCDCGATTIVAASKLTGGATRSCGCLMIESRGKCNIRHGKSTSREYITYASAKSRCSNPMNKSYGRYGGSGVEFRFSNFVEFIECVGFKPSPTHSLDRIDPRGNYEAGNVRWATPYEQANNKKENRLVSFRGNTMTMAELSRDCGVNYTRLRDRIDKGWSVEEAATTPIGVKRPRTTITDMARASRLSHLSVHKRLKRGWSLERALSEPSKRASIV